MAIAVLKTMDFEESAALEAITYSCMCYPVFLSKIHTYIHTYIHTCSIIVWQPALMLYSVHTYMQLLTYVHSCIVPFHVCDRMAAESIQAALLGMKTAQLNPNLP
jgi:hypothetical protein